MGNGEISEGRRFYLNRSAEQDVGTARDAGWMDPMRAAYYYERAAQTYSRLGQHEKARELRSHVDDINHHCR